MELDLTGKTAVVTGGSAGIGLAVARALAREGSQIALCGRDEARALKAAEMIRDEYGVHAFGMSADVTDPDAVAAVAARVEREFGGADVLFNNAGEGTNETIMGAPDDRWQHYWDLHVMAAVRMARGLVPGMRRRGGGVIVNNASICARQPLYHEPVYNVTKAALVMLSKCLAEELIPYGIRVNCVNPGLIRTAAWEDWARAEAGRTGRSFEDHLAEIAQDKTRMGRFGTPAELADFVAFLCSPRASYCVGSTYYIDGGWLNVVT